MSEIYISTDIETDGPIPGPNSMLSIGAAAFCPKHGMKSKFEINLEPLVGATIDLRTKTEFWDKHPEAWQRATERRVNTKTSLILFKDWVLDQGENPVFVAYPAVFDFAFINWYFHKFLGENPFGYSALDMKSYAMALLDTSFHGTTLKTMPKIWGTDLRNTHVAVEDAIEQGELFMRMLKASEDLNANIT